MSLRAELDRGGPLTAARAVALVAQVAVELDGLAADGGLRSDIVDPVNILLAADGSVSLAGSATAVEAAVTYLAPERVARTAPVSAATDVYALACVLSECLTGTAPHADGGAPIPPGFDAVVARGLAADPGDRFTSTGAFAVAARKALRGDPATAAPASGSPVRQGKPRTPVLSAHVRDVLSDPQITLPAAAGYRSVTEKVPPVSIGRRLRPVGIVAAVLFLVGMSVLAVRSVLGIEGAATGPQSTDIPLRILPDRGSAVDKAGNVYILGQKWDYSNHGVWKLAPGSWTPTKLPFPDEVFAQGVAVDAAGQVYVTTSRGNVAALSPDTGEVRTYPIPDQGNLKDIAVDASGNVIGVGSRSEAGHGVQWVWTLNTATGEVTRLPFPEGRDYYRVAVGPSGEVYATSGCVLLAGGFQETNWVWKLEAGATEPVKTPLGRARCPDELAVDSAGNLYVADRDYGPILLMVPQGWSNSIRLPMGDLKHMWDITVDGGGNVYAVIVDTDERTAALRKLAVQP